MTIHHGSAWGGLQPDTADWGEAKTRDDAAATFDADNLAEKGSDPLLAGEGQTPFRLGSKAIEATPDESSDAARR